MESKPKFGIIGAAGYVAPKHMKAIKDNQGLLVAAVDPNDSVGILDRYFADVSFFTSFERFERFVYKSKLIDPIDYISICSPNYHHDTHCRFALVNNCDAICEKPLVLNPWNLDQLQNAESEHNKSIFNILQLRLHPSIIQLKKEVESSPNKIFDIDLTYITSRGPWYHISWKGDPSKSGGVTSNIGVHFFDMLLWIFGECKQNIVHAHNPKYAAGFLQLEKANVRWFLSVDASDLPQTSIQENQRTHRSLVIDGQLIEFSSGFEDLHSISYKHILEGNGFTTHDVSPVIHLNHKIRTALVKGLTGDYHPLLRQK